MRFASEVWDVASGVALGAYVTTGVGRKYHPDEEKWLVVTTTSSSNECYSDQHTWEVVLGVVRPWAYSPVYPIIACFDRMACEAWRDGLIEFARDMPTSDFEGPEPCAEFMRWLTLCGAVRHNAVWCQAHHPPQFPMVALAKTLGWRPVSDVQRRRGVTVQCLRRGNNYAWVSATTVTRSREGGTVNYMRDYAGALELLK